MSASINAGDLDRRITLQSATITKDAVGGPVETWADVATVWASVRPLSSRQIALAQQVNAATNLSVLIRWRAGLSSALRVTLPDGRHAKVAHIDENRREGRAVLLCEAIDA